MFKRLNSGLWTYESASPTTNVYDVIRAWYCQNGTNLYDAAMGHLRTQPNDAIAMRCAEGLSIEEATTVVFPRLYIGDLLIVLRAYYTNYYAVGMCNARLTPRIVRGLHPWEASFRLSL